MFDRRHEKWVEEIAAHLELAEPLTASGAVMTLPPAAVADLWNWSVIAGGTEASNVTTGSKSLRTIARA